MNFAVYAIAKNEEQNVDRFMNSCKACGLPVYVLDTGSTDKTVENLKKHGAIVTEQRIDPWRYDVARNAALTCVPESFDYVIRLDLDEELQFDAYDRILEEISDHAESTRVNHLFQLDASIPDSISYHCCIHSRHGYEWKHPAHEIIVPKDGFTERLITLSHVLVRHYPPKDRRHTYSSILQAAYDAGDHSTRTTFMLGRDLYFEKKYLEAIGYLDKFLAARTDDQSERSYACTLIAKAMRQCDNKDGEYWNATRAFIECPLRRESCIEAAYACLRNGKHKESLWFVDKALGCTEGRYAPNNNPDDWTFKPHEIAMHAAYGLGDANQALKWGRQALDLATSEKDRTRIQQAIKTIGG